ncbi:MAG TPA: IclR family transcriptional regulator C-terminal domain-containing protein [Euzebya sp.]|nr:IclR family transcriptional regulator C-terminal domain-containing protein [Euzebya sp.]
MHSPGSTTRGPQSLNRTDFVQSLARGLEVMTAFTIERPRMSVSEVAAQTGQSRATARRLLLTLQALGYVRSHDRLFELAPRVLDLGYAYLTSQSIAEVAAPHIETLVSRTGEPASVAVLDEDEIVFVLRVPSRRVMRVALSVGSRLPVSASATGRVLLGGQPEEEAERILATARMPALTPRTTTDVDELRTQIRQARRDGFAIVDQQLELGVASAAVPVVGRDGTAVAAIATSISLARVTMAQLRKQIMPAMQDAAALVSEDLRRRH